jgi:hypothetical protein
MLTKFCLLTAKRLLQQENDDLKESLKEHQSVLEFIMSKYRDQMLKMIQIKQEQQMTENFYKNNLTEVKFWPKKT